MNTAANTLEPSLRQDISVISLIGLCHSSSHFSHVLLPLMFPVFTAELGLGYAELGGLMSAFFAVSFVGQMSSGFVVDRLGPRPVLLFALSLMALACWVISQAAGLPQLMIGAMMLGLGNSVFHPVDFSVLNQQVSPARLGYAFSTHNVTGTLGWAVAPVFMVGLGSAFDWHVAYIGAACVYLAIALICIWQRHLLDIDSTPASQAQAAKPKLQTSWLLRQPAIGWSFLFLFFATMTLSVIQSFAVSILQKMHGLSFAMANLTLTAYLVTAAIGIFVGGFIAVKFPSRSDKVVSICMVSGAVWLGLCATGWLGPVFSPIALVLTAFTVSMGSPSRDLMIKRATPAGATGRVYGLVYSGLDVGSATSPLFFGWFMDHGLYGATLGGAALVLLLGSITAWKLAQSISKINSV
jgi:MFS family permease